MLKIFLCIWTGILLLLTSLLTTTTTTTTTTNTIITITIITNNYDYITRTYVVQHKKLTIYNLSLKIFRETIIYHPGIILLNHH